MLVVVPRCASFGYQSLDFKDAHLVGGNFNIRTVATNLLLIQNVTLDDSVFLQSWTLLLRDPDVSGIAAAVFDCGPFAWLVLLLCAWGVSALAFELLKGNLHSNLDFMFAPCFVAGVIVLLSAAAAKRRGNLPFALFSAPALVVAIAGLQFKPGFARLVGVLVSASACCSPISASSGLACCVRAVASLRAIHTGFYLPRTCSACGSAWSCWQPVS